MKTAFLPFSGKKIHMKGPVMAQSRNAPFPIDYQCSTTKLTSRKVIFPKTQLSKLSLRGATTASKLSIKHTHTSSKVSQSWKDSWVSMVCMAKKGWIARRQNQT